jgi:nucleotide-binding universal stress UspA family protein
MAVRVVLGLIDGGPGTDGAASAALSVADSFDAYLHLLHVCPDPESLIPIIVEGMSGPLLHQIVERFRTGSSLRTTVARQLFEVLEARRNCLPGDGKATITFRQEVGREDEVAARLARLHGVGRCPVGKALNLPN